MKYSDPTTEELVFAIQNCYSIGDTEEICGRCYYKKYKFDSGNDCMDRMNADIAKRLQHQSRVIAWYDELLNTAAENANAMEDENLALH